MEAKGALIGMRCAGMSQRAVAVELGTDPKVVAKVEKTITATGSVENKPRSGHPWVVNKVERRYILRLIRKDRRISWDALVSAVDHRVCAQAIRRVVSFHYKRKWRTMKRPNTSKESTRSRRQLACIWIPRTEEMVEVSSFKVLVVA
jgi:transposase